MGVPKNTSKPDREPDRHCVLGKFLAAVRRVLLLEAVGEVGAGRAEEPVGEGAVEAIEGKFYQFSKENFNPGIN